MKRVLVTPLDWGLGHATRCIPVIRELLNRQCEVFIGGNGDSLALLKAEFPSLIFFDIPGYRPVYPSNGKSMVWTMVLQLPKFFMTIKKEHWVVEELIREHNIQLVISDNRYGCWSSSVPCIFITHQSNILMPKRFGWLESKVRKRNEAYIKRFTRCWLPDDPENQNLAGDLASFDKMKERIKFLYVGSLSRFKSTPGHVKKKYDVVAVFSGPEPQRTALENRVLPQLKRSKLKYFVVLGKLRDEPLPDPDCVNFLTTEALREVIESADIIIARSGYSTIMDMAALAKKVIFIPTPGQTEQEYLALRLMDKKISFFMKQEEFDLSFALKEAGRFSGFSRALPGRDLLLSAIDDALQN